jgi:hypothetical protein
MLFLVKIIVFSLFIICCFHYFYDKFTEKICKNGNNNKNRIEYHTSKYKEILNDISTATKLSERSVNKLENRRTFEEREANKYSPGCNEGDNVSMEPKTHMITSADIPLFSDLEKQNMYNELIQMI